jgi:hypothetical protein
VKFKFLRHMVIGFSLMVGAHANAGLITKDYSNVGDGHLTVDTIGQMEWLDVSIFVGMNLDALQGTNQWTIDGFHLATDAELVALWKNVGVTYILDYAGNLDFGTSHTAASLIALTDLYLKLGGGASNFGGHSYIHGITADMDNNGLSYLARMKGTGTAHVNTNGDNYGNTGQTVPTVGAFFVRSVAVPEPSSLAIFALGIIGLASRRLKKQS